MTPDGPTFLIIGAARSGTTLLSQVLAQHPAIFVTDPKEPHFLAFARERAAFTGPGDAEGINRFSVTDEPAWRGLFVPGRGHAQRCDGSVSTLYYAEAAVGNIRRYCPDVKMIALLREPTSRAFSAHSYLTGRGRETETFERGLELEQERIASGFHHMWHYTSMGYYSRQLEPFFATFDREQLLVIGYEDLVADPATKLKACFDFVGLDQAGITELGAEVNIGGQPHSRTLTRTMNRLREYERVRALVRRASPLAARDWLRRKNLRRTELSPDTRRSLDELYEPERKALADLLGADAPSWCGPS